MSAWLEPVPVWVWGALSAASLIGLVFAVLALPRVIARLPERWFVEPSPTFASRLRAAPAATLCRNACAMLLLLMGVAMLVLPGQGVLTILAGLLLSDLPLRDRAVRALVSRPRVARALQRLRAMAGAPAFVGL